MSSSAGRVLIIPKGEYNNATQYQMLDIVRYNGSMYIAKKTTIGNTPADGEYWMLCVIGASNVRWGDITGILANQSDLVNALDAKQNTLTFDNIPTAGSTNPVTSDGIASVVSALNSNLSQKVSSVNGETPDTNGNVSLNAEDIPSNGIGSKEVSGNPIIVTDAVAENAQNLSVELEPIQDLHGYDHPWAGGAGKNKLPVLYSSTTKNGVTFTVDSDGTVTATGTATANAEFSIAERADNVAIPLGSYILSGLPSEGSATTFRWNVDLYNSDGSIIFDQRSGSPNMEITLSENAKTSIFRIRIVSGYTANNLVFKPMLRLASETDATFEPYSNICPITGRTQVDVTRTGKNLLPIADTPTYSGLTIIKNNDGSYSISGKPNSNGSIEFYNDASNPIRITEPCIFTSEWNPQNSATIIFSTVESTTAIQTSNSDTLNIPVGEYTRFRIYVNSANTYNFTFKPMLRLASETDTTFEPYSGQSVTVNLGQTVYGGTLNVSTGELTVETANIASYNGESIGEPWWSSMDEYVAGTTPTTGAQVVYTLATPTTVSLTPAQLALLEGYNILTTDGDTINLRYTGKNVQARLAYLSDKVAALDTGITVQFASTGWITTETVNNTTYYTQEVSVTSVSGTPIVGISPISGTLPTSAEQEAFNSVEYFTANDTTNTIKAYAESAPSDTFAVVVKGAR